jgi:hypothetical protein
MPYVSCDTSVYTQDFKQNIDYHVKYDQITHISHILKLFYGSSKGIAMVVFGAKSKTLRKECS